MRNSLINRLQSKQLKAGHRVTGKRLTMSHPVDI